MPHALFHCFLYNGVLKAVVASRPWVAHTCPFSRHVASHSFPRCLVHVISILSWHSSACRHISVRYLSMVCCRSSVFVLSPRFDHFIVRYCCYLEICLFWICCYIRRSFTKSCSVHAPICLMCCHYVFFVCSYSFCHRMQHQHNCYQYRTNPANPLLLLLIMAHFQRVISGESQSRTHRQAGAYPKINVHDVSLGMQFVGRYTWLLELLQELCVSFRRCYPQCDQKGYLQQP